MLRTVGPRTASPCWVPRSLRRKTPEGVLGGTKGGGPGWAVGCEVRSPAGAAGAGTRKQHARSDRAGRTRLAYGRSQIHRVTFIYHVNGSCQTESLAFRSGAGVPTAAQLAGGRAVAPSLPLPGAAAWNPRRGVGGPGDGRLSGASGPNRSCHARVVGAQRCPCGRQVGGRASELGSGRGGW